MLSLSFTAIDPVVRQRRDQNAAVELHGVTRCYFWYHYLEKVGGDSSAEITPVLSRQRKAFWKNDALSGKRVAGLYSSYCMPQNSIYLETIRAGPNGGGKKTKKTKKRKKTIVFRKKHSRLSSNEKKKTKQKEAESIFYAVQFSRKTQSTTTRDYRR